MVHELLNTLPILAEFRTTDLIPAAGIMLLITALIIGIRKRRRMQATQQCLTPQEQLERNRQLRGVQGDMERLMVELEQFSKRLSAQLDAKTVAVEHLLRQADERIAQLRKLSGNGQDASPAATADAGETRHRSEPARAAVPPADLPSDPLSRSVYQLADQGLAPDAIAKRLNEHVGKVELILALRSA